MSIMQRAYPSAAQLAVLEMHLGHARYLYNLGLEQRGYHVKGQAFRLGGVQQQRELADARTEVDWLRAGSSSVQQAALRDLDRAFRNFFDRRVGYPEFKKRHRGRESFVVRDLVVRRLNKRWARSPSRSRRPGCGFVSRWRGSGSSRRSLRVSPSTTGYGR
ncbi:helix-turn-helix domain-containing protein [Nocardia seriolae]|nr:helix-turn-helix domain-containing protein [Nocardia seriolae]MTJ72999.1 helix-turn-helix domain-containing protein [Nocardia seriolae]MTJ89562.1 helix-turn-helix domain-containing protein [Nocardia seriolae]MTK33536.1 helix-turn-helix domain-containing protein [Nocardia seriolae]MTK42679.1 helix-turn-helix domain-containing protein [Nocardia seriolae]